MPHRKDNCECGKPKGVEASRCRSCAAMLRRSARCGTDSGYYRHRRDGQEACEACLRAHREAQAERDRRRAAERRAAREARRTCPACGGPKSESAKRCKGCAVLGGRRVPHGTESGYQYEVRHHELPCADCTAAHASYNRGRPRRNPRRRSKPAPRRCRCGATISGWSRSLLCRSCSHRRDEAARGTWVQRRGVWLLAS